MAYSNIPWFVWTDISGFHDILDIKLEWFSKISKRVKVAVTGLLLAPIYYWLFHLKQEDIGILLLSYLVTFAFHKLIAEFFIEKIKSLLPYKVKISTKTKQDE